MAPEKLLDFWTVSKGIIPQGQGCCSRSDSAKWCKMKTHHPSDFVTNSYVESSGTHLVKSHESLSRVIDSHFNNESLGLL